VIVEGDEALSKGIGMVPENDSTGVFVNAAPSMSLRNNRFLIASDLRLIREILDLEHRRGQTPITTIKEWPARRKGQMDVVYPSWEKAPITFNSFLAYELPVLKELLDTKLAQALGEAKTYNDQDSVRLIERLLDILKGVPRVGAEVVPQGSILQQVISGRFIFNETERFPRKTD